MTGRYAAGPGIIVTRQWAPGDDHNFTVAVISGEIYGMRLDMRAGTWPLTLAPKRAPYVIIFNSFTHVTTR